MAFCRGREDPRQPSTAVLTCRVATGPATARQARVHSPLAAALPAIVGHLASGGLRARAGEREHSFHTGQHRRSTDLSVKLILSCGSAQPVLLFSQHTAPGAMHAQWSLPNKDPSAQPGCLHTRQPLCCTSEGGEAGCAGAAVRTTPMDESARAGRRLRGTCSTQSTVQAPGSALAASHTAGRPTALASSEGAIQTLTAATGPAAAAGRGARKVGT